MLKQYYSETGQAIAGRLTIERDADEGEAVDTLFIHGLGYIRAMMGTDIARYSSSILDEENELEDIWHHDFIGYDEICNRILSLIESNKFDLDVIHGVIMEHALTSRYAYSRHWCESEDPEICSTCAEIEAEVEASMEEDEDYGDEDE
jgi:hypothetical protein